VSANVYAGTFACTTSVFFCDESSQGRGSACLKMCMRALLHVQFLCFLVTNRLKAEVVCLKMCQHLCVSSCINMDVLCGLVLRV